MMILPNTRFGTVEFDDADILHLEGGLVGLPDLQRFVLFQAKPDSPFSWLQSLDDPAMAFLVAEPSRYVPDYERDVARRLPGIPGCGRARDRDGSARQAARDDAQSEWPDRSGRQDSPGKQMVLDDAAYTTRYRVFPSSETCALAA